MTTMTKTRTLLVDDHVILRSGLKLMLEADAEVEVVGEASDGAEAIRLVDHLEPDLIIMDLQMPRLSGLEACEEIKRKHPRAKVLMLSMAESDDVLFKVLKAGGNGFVPKRSAEAELLTAIKEVLRGGTYLREPTTLRLVRDLYADMDAGHAPDGLDLLTPREREVLALIASGLTNQEIADKFVISIRTVETHRAHIIDKLGLRKRSELVNYALRKGLIE
jgi:two-component system response regulator NreC